MIFIIYASKICSNYLKQLDAVSEKLEFVKNYHLFLNESFVGMAFNPINSFLNQLTSVYILLFCYFVLVFLKDLFVKLWKNEMFLFQPKLLGLDLFLFDFIDIIWAKTYLFIYFLCGKYIKFKDCIKLFIFFFIVISLNLSIIKIMLVLYTISFIKFKSLVFIKYTVFSKLIGKKLIFKRWGVLRNGFITEHINMWKHMSQLHLKFKSQNASFPYQMTESQIAELQMSEEAKNIYLDLIKSYKLLITAASYHENLGSGNLNETINDASIRWKTLSIWNEKNGNTQIRTLIQRGEEWGEKLKEEESKEEEIKNFKKAILELGPEAVLKNLLLSVESAENAQNLIKSEVLPQKAQIVRDNLVAHLLKKKHEERRKEDENWIIKKREETLLRDENFLKKQKQIESANLPNEELKKTKLKRSPESIVSFFSKKKELSNEYFQRNKFFRFYTSENDVKSYKTKEYYFSEISIIYEKSALTQNLKQPPSLDGFNEFNEFGALFKKCKSEGFIRSDEFIGAKKSTFCNIILGEYNNIKKCSIYTNEKIDFGSFKNNETSAFNYHPKLISIKSADVGKKNIISFFNLTSNHTRKEFLTDRKPFLKTETLGSILSFRKDNFAKYNSDSEKLLPQSIIIATMESQQNEIKLSTNPLLCENSDDASNQENFQIVSLEENYEIRESTWKNFLHINNINSIEDDFKKNFASIHIEHNLKNQFARSNEFYNKFIIDRINDSYAGKRADTETLFQLSKDIKKINIICEASAWTNLTLKSEFFIKNKEILANELCRCNSLDVLTANRLQFVFKQAMSVETKFKKEFEAQTTEILKNNCYSGNEDMVKLNLAFYAILKTAHSEKILNEKFGFTNSSMGDHGISNLPLSFFLANEVLKNPLYGVNSDCEVKDFSKILDAIGPVAL